MEMGRKRRSFTDKFKAQVAIEAVKGIKTLAEPATEYQVHPNHIIYFIWRSAGLKRGPLFPDLRAKRAEKISA